MPLPSPPPIDYTSRDYLSLRGLMLDLANQYVPEWTDKRSSDFGVVLVELFAAMGDILSLYTDRLAGEFLIDYITRRSNMIQLLKLIGYNLSSGTAAGVYLSVTSVDATASAELLFGGAKFGGASHVFETTVDRIFGYQFLTVDTDGDTNLVFIPDTGAFEVGDVVELRSSTKSAEEGTITEVNTSLSAIRLANPPSEGYDVSDNAYARVKTAKVFAEEGTTVRDEILGVSNGAPGQGYTLKTYPVIHGSQTIIVHEDQGEPEGEYVGWLEVDTLLDSAATDRHYVTSTDASGRLVVEFGDGTNGMIPPQASSILAVYRVGGGESPNYLAPGAINRIVSAPSFVKKVTNLESPTGGSDPESMEEARIRGPLSVRTNDRAVTAEDYVSKAIAVPGVAKASAKVHSSGWNSVALYIVPDGGGYPASTLKLAVLGAVQEKALLTTSVYVLDPTYYTVNLDATVRIDANALATDVQLNVETAIQQFFSLSEVDFGTNLYRSDLTNIIEDVRGVESIVYDRFTVVPVVVDGQQTGDPIFGTVTVYEDAEREDWLVIFDDEFEPTVFSVTGSVSGPSGHGTLDTAFTIQDVLSFTITSGSIAPVFGDNWGFSTEPYNAQSIEVPDDRIPSLGTVTITTSGGQ